MITYSLQNKYTLNILYIYIILIINERMIYLTFHIAFHIWYP